MVSPLDQPQHASIPSQSMALDRVSTADNVATPTRDNEVTVNSTETSTASSQANDSQFIAATISKSSGVQKDTQQAPVSIMTDSELAKAIKEMPEKKLSRWQIPRGQWAAFDKCYKFTHSDIVPPKNTSASLEEQIGAYVQ